MMINIKTLDSLQNQLSILNNSLNGVITSAKFDNFSQIAFDIAEELDKINDIDICEKEIKELYEKGLNSEKKKIYINRMVKFLSPKVELLVEKAKRENPNVNSLFYSYESKGFRNTSIERLEALKLQLNLIEQRGFYALSKDKSKVRLQADILFVAARLIETLTYKTGIAEDILNNFKKIEDYESYESVTKTEEDTISLCYSLLLNQLIDVDFK